MPQDGREPARAVFPEPERSGYTNDYFDTPDIEATTAKVSELGGEAGEKSPVPVWGGSRRARTARGTVPRLAGGRLGVLAARYRRAVSGGALATTLAVAAGLAGSIQVAVMSRLGERIGVVEALGFATGPRPCSR